MKGPAVFLDRDGTLMRDVDYCGNPHDVHLLPGVSDALRLLQQRGFKLIVVTNQSGIGRGYFDEQQYKAVEAELDRQLGPGTVVATYYCPHLPDDGCKCRKPSPELIFKAAREHDVDLTRSFFIGDKSSDIECGKNAGVRTILVRTGYGNATEDSTADFVANDLVGAVDVIEREA
jgi:D-glycero-D-manno-heptose 1,7-bisphosphate phosphatase